MKGTNLGESVVKLCEQDFGKHLVATTAPTALSVFRFESCVFGMFP